MRFFSSLLFLVLLVSTTSRTLDKPEIDYLKKIGHDYELLSFKQRIKNGAIEYNNFVSSIKGVTFSGQFTSNMILQREPYYAKVYGAADIPNTLIIIILNDLQNNREYIFETYSQLKSQACPSSQATFRFKV